MESWYANEWQIKVWECVATDGNGAADWLRSVSFGVLTTNSRDERIDFEIRVTDAVVDSIPLLLFVRVVWSGFPLLTILTISSFRLFAFRFHFM